MIGIFLVYWVGKKYYDLATRHGRSPWGFAILAISIYFGSQIVLGVFIAIFFPSFFDNLSQMEETLMNLLSIPFSLGIWYLVLRHLTKKWEAIENNTMDDYETQIEQIGKEE